MSLRHNIEKFYSKLTWLPVPVPYRKVLENRKISARHDAQLQTIDLLRFKTLNPPVISMVSKGMDVDEEDDFELAENALQYRTSLNYNKIEYYGE